MNFQRESMSKLQRVAVQTVAGVAFFFSAAALAVAPVNPSLEDLPDLDGWAVLDIGDVGGAGWVVRGEDATDGDAFGRLSFWAEIDSGATAYGPAFQSPTFSAGAGAGAGAGEEISVDWRVYWIGFTATDAFGASCNSTVKVSVPHDKKTPAGDAGPLFDSTSCP